MIDFGRIPEEFWHLAAEVAPVEGVEETARALRLDSARLERQVEGPQVAATTQTAPLEYVEFGASEVGLTTQRASLEVVTAGGDRLRIEVVGAIDVPASCTLSQSAAAPRHPALDLQLPVGQSGAMPYAYTNRHSLTLYLHAGPACGEPFVFREAIGEAALDAVPDGFAVYEDSNGRVRLVLEEDDLVTDAHVQMVRSALKSTPYADYGVEVVDEAIVIMQPDWTRAELARFLDRPANSLTADEIRDNTHYAPIMCFEPSLDVDGHYCLMRMVFDPIPGWSEPLLEGPLEELAARLEPHLCDAVSSDF